MKTAHLYALVNTETMNVESARIMSDSDPTLYGRGMRWLRVTTFRASTFHEAAQFARKSLQPGGSNEAWAKVWDGC